MRFIEYTLTSDILSLGERAKGGIIKPCVKTIPYSQISGALRKKFNITDLNTIHAVGYLVEEDGFNQSDFLIYYPRDRSIETSKIPLQIEFLQNVFAKVYIVENDVTKNFPSEFDIFMGAMRSKGIGRCKLKRIKIITDIYKTYGILNVRIPEKYKEKFLIEMKDKPIFGYLFEPTSLTTGVYIKAFFEGSMVAAPDFLLKEGSFKRRSN